MKKKYPQDSGDQDQIKDEKGQIVSSLVGDNGAKNIMVYSIMAGTVLNGERAAKLSDLAMLWVYSYDPSGNLLHEAASGSETEAPIIEHIYLGNRLVSSVTGYGSACFIASVAYGTPLSEDLDVFRAFRDKVLTRMTVGEVVINWYYKRGPVAANWLEGHKTARAATYYTLVMLAVPLKAFMFGHWALYPILFTLCLCVFVVGKKLGWKRSTSLALVFTLAFSTIIVYSFLVDVPVSSASYSERTKYYYTLDHIGRPMNLRDENLYLRWYEQHYPFGEIITEDVPTWDIQAGSGSSTISWTPHFRFPGQFEDADQGPFVHNHYREYMPELGRYNRVDPLYVDKPFFVNLNDKFNDYMFFSYSNNNPIIVFDCYGLCILDTYDFRYIVGIPSPICDDCIETCYIRARPNDMCVLLECHCSTRGPEFIPSSNEWLLGWQSTTCVWDCDDECVDCDRSPYLIVMR